MSQTPSSKPREDPPASGPAPDVQVPGDSSSEQHPPRLSEGAPGRVTFSDGDPGDEQAPSLVNAGGATYARLPVVFPFYGRVELVCHGQDFRVPGKVVHRLEYVESAV